CFLDPHSRVSSASALRIGSMAVLTLKPSEDALEYFNEAGLTDGLPVALPTRKRVNAMLRGSALERLHVIGNCPPSYAEVTVEKVAIAAVMAGCVPEMFRLVLAATKAMLRPEFGLHGVHATTMGATPVVVVNGPCRLAAGVNCQLGVCGSGHRSHCIGRALKLLLQNVGRARLGGTESTTLGTPMKFGLCFGEWEERSKWQPLALEEKDAVTVLACAGGPTQLVDFSSTPKELLQRLSALLAMAYAPQMPLVNQVLLIISPEHHDSLVKGGFDSKKKLAQALWRQTCRAFLPHVGAAVVQVLQVRGVPVWLAKSAGLLVTMCARVMALLGKPFLALPKFSGPESFNIVVAGGGAGKFSAFCPGFGVGKKGMATAEMSLPCTEPVEPRPDALDRGAELAGEEGQELLDPRGAAAAEKLQLAARSGEIQGPVALVDISKARGSELLAVFEQILRQEGVETRRYVKPTFSRPCPSDLRKRISAECRSAILGLAD
ncbi:unnamed protein product, partial [Effrenium voratum]